MPNKEKMPIYRISRPTLGTLFKLWYRPKIIGRENIPKEGPIILVGNHVNIMDQCNVAEAVNHHICQVIGEPDLYLLDFA